MAVVAPMNTMAAAIATQAPPAVIVVTQSVKSPMGTPPILGGAGGTRAYPFVG